MRIDEPDVEYEICSKAKITRVQISKNPTPRAIQLPYRITTNIVGLFKLSLN
eukprot:Ihof_evm2s599 gene=Ihof_evmTU2s599